MADRQEDCEQQGDTRCLVEALRAKAGPTITSGTLWVLLCTACT